MSREREMQRIVDAACQWWMRKRPIAYTLDEHIENPKVNTRNDSEAELAKAVARYTRPEASDAVAVRARDMLNEKGDGLAYLTLPTDSPSPGPEGKVEP